MEFNLTKYAESYGSLHSYDQSIIISDLEEEIENGLLDKLYIKDQDEIFIVINFFILLMENLHD